MGFEIKQLHIPDSSPEGRIIGAMVNRDHVSPEEAVRRLLRGLALVEEQEREQDPTSILGAFSSPEDAAMLDEIVAEAYERRRLDVPRDFGL